MDLKFPFWLLFGCMALLVMTELLKGFGKGMQ